MRIKHALRINFLIVDIYHFGAGQGTYMKTKHQRGNIEEWAPGFQMERRRIRRFRMIHQHSEIEVGVVTGGTCSFIFGGVRILRPPGCFSVIWGSVAHGAMEVVSGDPFAYTLHIPVAMFMEWKLPKILLDCVLERKYVVDVPRTRPCSDMDLMKYLAALLKKGDRAAVEIVMLDVQLRLRRLARTLDLSSEDLLQPELVTPHRENKVLESMLLDITRRHRERLSVANIAHAAGISPSHAMHIFRHGCGMTILDYINRCRITTAQQLLISTNDKLLSIALESGFGSVDRFYSVFKRCVGQTPRQFRSSIKK